MKELIGNVFDLMLEPDVGAICITTNVMVNAQGQNIMGAGIAKAASDRWPEVRLVLGKLLKIHGNIPLIIGYIDVSGKYFSPNKTVILNKEYKCLIWSFPTKHNWMDQSDITLIEKSAKILVQRADQLNLNKICLPVPGCSNGGLKYSDVKKIIEPILDDRFYITALPSEKLF